jgi:hypothetical protein
LRFSSSHPFALSSSKDRISPFRDSREGQGFDKLSPNGEWWRMPIRNILILTGAGVSAERACDFAGFDRRSEGLGNLWL